VVQSEKKVSSRGMASTKTRKRKKRKEVKWTQFEVLDVLRIKNSRRISGV
jgi:hypothetical protein